VQVPDDSLFQGIVRAAFATRRKTLLNALLEKSKRPRNTVVELMDSAGIDPARRGETLSVEDFARLTTAFHDAGVVIRAPGKLN
jgi:16S rRNA (adenine1518-N6/adenine1519-N6)-dimethyltransferase